LQEIFTAMNPQAFFKLTYGLYVVSSNFETQESGFVCNTVMQVTSDPQQITVCTHKHNLTTELIQKSGCFAVSVLSKNSKPQIFGTFGYRSGHDISKFEKVEYFRTANQLPVLTEDCIAWFECEVSQTIDLGTHILFIGKVLNNEILNDNEPITYAYYHEVLKLKSPKNAPTFHE